MGHSFLRPFPLFHPMMFASDRPFPKASRYPPMFARILALLFAATAVASAEPPRRYSFVPETPAGFTEVKPGTAFTKERGFGFDLGTKVEKPPFYFSVALPEGNYNV